MSGACPVPAAITFRRGSVDVSIATFLIGHPTAEQMVRELAISNAAVDQGVSALSIALVATPAHVRRDPDIPSAQRRTYEYMAFIPTGDDLPNGDRK